MQGLAEMALTIVVARWASILPHLPCWDSMGLDSKKKINAMKDKRQLKASQGSHIICRILWHSKVQAMAEQVHVKKSACRLLLKGPWRGINHCQDIHF